MKGKSKKEYVYKKERKTNVKGVQRRINNKSILNIFFTGLSKLFK